MRVFEIGYYPRSWELGERSAAENDRTLVWRRCIGPYRVQVWSVLNPPPPGRPNISWGLYDGRAELHEVRFLATEDSALMETAQRQVIANLRTKIGYLDQALIHCQADLEEHLSPELAVAMNPQPERL